MNITSTPSWRQRLFLPGRVAAIATVATLLSASPALAQLGVMGGGGLGAAPVRGTDTGYDPVHNIYLVVGGTGGNLETPLFGVFVDAGSGQIVGGPFQIKNAGAHAYFPRVAYSPHVNGGNGGFLVAWQGGTWDNQVRARIVAYPNGVVNGETILPTTPTHQEVGPALAYSLSSQLFMVAWQSGDFKVWGALINTSGQLANGPFLISDPGQGARDPSVAWNLYTNEFGVLYSGFNSSGATTTFARVNTSGMVVRRNTFHGAVGTFITDLGFNPATGRFVGAWFQGGTYGAEIDANGDVVALGLVSTGTGSRDGLGLSYNPVSGTFLLVGQGNSWNIWGAELNSRGARTSADTEISSGGVLPGSFHPRAGTHASLRNWGVSFLDHTGGMSHLLLQTSSSSGGPAGTLGTFTGGGGGTPAPPPPSGGCPGTAPFPGAVCVNGGWIPGDTGGGGSGGGGTGGSSGGTGGCTTPDPFTAIGGGTCVDGGWIPGGGGSSGGSTGGCPGSAPFPGAVCVNGGWVQGSGGSSGGSGGCTTPDPFTAMGGGTCVNGGWIFGGGGSSGGGGSTGGCTTGSPGAGWICVNGGWVQGSNSGVSGGCTTPDPFAAIGGGTCINGGWVYGSSSVAPSSSTSSSCSTPDPFVALGGGTCVNGGWTLNDSSSCATPDPFTAMGGGVCIAGGWVPKG